MPRSARVSNPALHVGGLTLGKYTFGFDSVHKHAVASVTESQVGGANVGAYNYDTLGNMTCRVETPSGFATSPKSKIRYDYLVCNVGFARRVLCRGGWRHMHRTAFGAVQVRTEGVLGFAPPAEIFIHSQT